MQFPTSIHPCPIIEGIFEIKFNSRIPKPAILGMVYNQFKDEYPIVENLSASQLPVEIINSDPNFKYKAFHKLVGDHYIILVGFDVIAITINNTYRGWNDFKPKIVSFLQGINKIGLVESPVSAILRYINLFDGDIYQNINLDITLNNNTIVSNNAQVQFQLDHGDYIKSLQVSNNVNYSTASVSNRLGSIIDVSVSTFHHDLISNRLEEVIEEMHTIEKDTFFQLLKTPFLQTLNPTYS